MENNTTKDASIRIDVLREIKTPLGYFALAILVVEAILAALAIKATGFDLTVLVCGMVFSLVLLIAFVGYLSIKKPETLVGVSKQIPKVSLKHDVFLSSPMAAYDNDAEYKRDRENALAIINTLKQECRFDSVIYAGNEIKSISDFEAADISVNKDFQALLESRYFVLLYPKKLASSVLVEAGWAIALGKVSLYFVRDRDDLPFLLKQAEQAFSSVKIYDNCTAESIIHLLKTHRRDLFSTRSTKNHARTA